MFLKSWGVKDIQELNKELELYQDEDEVEIEEI